MKYPDGNSEELEEIFASEGEADEAGLDAVSSFSRGAEILNMSNPGDYPLDDQDADYEVMEIS